MTDSRTQPIISVVLRENMFSTYGFKATLVKVLGTPAPQEDDPVFSSLHMFPLDIFLNSASWTHLGHLKQAHTVTHLHFIITKLKSGSLWLLGHWGDKANPDVQLH